MKTQVLGTGLTGLVGSRLVEMFEDKYEFLNMDLSTNVDITDPQAIENFIKKYPDAKTLIHLAAFTNVNEAFDQADDEKGTCYKVNVDGTKNIVNSCKKHDIYLIHISTDFVFSGNKTTPYTEDDPRDPIEWYGKTKAMAEELVESGLSSYSIARLGYPLRAKYDAKPHMLTKTLQGLESGKLYPQFSDMIITPTYVDDLAKSLDKIIELHPTGIYHLHGSTSLSPFELSKKIAKMFGHDPSVIKEGSLKEYQKSSDRPYQAYLRMDNSKTQRELGIKLKNIEEILADIKSQLTQ